MVSCRARRIVPALMLTLFGTATSAQVPLGTDVTYQGRLEEAGQPLDGAVNLVFQLFDVAAGGAPLGMQTLNGVIVANGLFTVSLNGAGEFGPNAFNGEKRWLAITVDGTPLTPRQAITAAPYAARALSAPNGHALDAADGSPVDALFVDNAGNVGIGTAAPSQKLQVSSGNLQVDRGTSTASLTRTLTLGGVRGTNNIDYAAVNFQNYDSNSAAVDYLGARISSRNSGDTDDGDLRFATASDQTLTTRMLIDPAGNVGIGTLTPTNRLTVFGGDFSLQTADNAIDRSILFQNSGGSYSWRIFRSIAGNSQVDLKIAGGSSVSDPTTLPVRMTLTNEGRTGIGTTAPSAQFEVVETDLNHANTAIFGHHQAASGITYGAYGISDSTSGTGARGWANAATGTTYGIYGRATSASGWGVYANGRIGATGTKSFVIDHPQRPTEAYLLHYSAEGPVPQDVYNGTVVLEADGGAVVQLPDYFESLNIDYRYQLTPIGAPAPNLYVAEEVTNNRFRIAGGSAGLKVSWQVTGQRNDAFVQQRGAPVEVIKNAEERGKYLMPELYGQPPEMGIHYDAHSDAGTGVDPISGKR